MNSAIIRYILGQVLKIEGTLMLLPFVVSLIYNEDSGIWYLTSAFICVLLGFMMTCLKPENTTFYLKEGCVTTALSWIFLSFFGCLPLWISGEIPSFTDALFETVSGFTTTGATILSDVEALSYTALFWRSLTHWIGGMGVLVFLLAIIPMSGGSHMNLMKAESTGPSVGKLVPKVKHTARILYIIYLVLTITQLVLLLAGGMPLFDAITTSFSTAGTGGFSIKNDSMIGYSPYLQWVCTIFMILCGINFNAYFLLILRNFKKAFTMEEVRCYFIIILTAIVIIFIDISDMFTSSFEALTHAAFQVGSIITSTGFATTDYEPWPQTSRTVLVLLMFIGACAGSTGGGIKVSRIIIMIKTVFKELLSYIHPKSIKKIQFEGKPVEHEVVRSVNVFFITFTILFAGSVFALSLEGKDLVTNFTAVAATINNIGPGLSMVGPMANFGHFTDFSKFVLIFDMIAGRLELFPLLILFHPAMWKELFSSKLNAKKDF